VKRFIHFHNIRHPAEMADPEINASLPHPALREDPSASTQTRALGALLFLHGHIFMAPASRSLAARLAPVMAGVTPRTIEEP
jgi:hypothetical protein